ncbi:MAG: HDOD domain-containing protein [Gammaproteobacteria bacterium]|nr:HDOD domain-containing protein [Gammaproteobacteria bacterium]
MTRRTATPMDLIASHKIPAVPHVLLKLVQACHQPNVGFDELASILRKDAALSAKIIAAANASVFAQWRGVEDLHRLLVVLGINNVKSIAVTTAVQQFFNRFSRDGGRGMGFLWRRSLTCAYVAKALAKLTSFEAPEEAYTAGLLHRLGQLVLISNYEEVYLPILLNATYDRVLNDLEMEKFGITYQEIGATLLGRWDPNSFMADAIRYQGEPAKQVQDTPRLVRLVNLAHKLSSHHADPEQLLEEADLLFGLEQGVIEEIIEESREQVIKAAVGLGITLDKNDDASALFEADSEEIRLALAKEVQNLALINGVGRQIMASDGLEDLLKSIMHNLHLLFSSDTSAVFMPGSDNKSLILTATSGLQDERLFEIAIPLLPERSLVTDSLLLQEVMLSEEPTPGATASVLDIQLSRMLKADGLLCIPLIHGDTKIGVLAAGISQAQSTALNQSKTLMGYFGGVIAQALHRQNQAKEQRVEQLEETRVQINLETRKLAHEVNNPLGVLKNYLHVLSGKLGEDDSVQDQLQVLKDEVERIGNIVLRMRDIPEPLELEPGKVDINKLIQELFQVFKIAHFAPHKIEGLHRLDSKIPQLLTDRNHLKQILVNLIKNAIEAMPDGGELTVTTRDRVIVNGVSNIELCILDNGPGIPANILQELFKPMETTKGPGHSGLGLAIVNNLVASLDGSISCSNREGSGTEFRILLPRREAN